MIYLSGNTSGKLLEQYRKAGVGVMITFPQKCTPTQTALTFALDNGCFNNPDLDVDDYLRWLDRITRSALFAPAPDVVGNSRATWKRSESVLPQIRALGHRAALVAQDGIEDYPIRWDSFDCLFIGGSTEWKLSDGARWLIQKAKQSGKWVHFGRVNSRRRLRFAAMEGCDSADGTHVRFKPDIRIAQLKNWLDELKRQPFLVEDNSSVEDDMLVTDLLLTY